MEWVDAEMVDKASRTSRLIHEIDRSYTKYIHNIKKNQNERRIPFPKDKPYTMFVKDDSIYVFAWTGKLEIKWLVGNTTYALSEPISFETTIAGEFNAEDSEFRGFAMNPAYGFHFTDDPIMEKWPAICTGQLNSPEKFESITELERWAVMVADTLKTVNTKSLGQQNLPRGCPYAIMRDRDADPIDMQILDMVRNGFLKKII